MRQILFHTDLVKAIQDGGKSVTRRLVKFPAGYDFLGTNKDISENIKLFGKEDLFHDGEPTSKSIKPPYLPGDILYVRETAMIQSMKNFNKEVKLIFKADNKLVPFVVSPEYYEKLCQYPDNKWLSPYYLTKETARIFLRVTNVRVERLQEITSEQVKREGLCPYIHLSGEYNDHANKTQYRSLWNSTIPKKDLLIYGWNANPWVWVIEFEIISREEALKHG